MKSLIRVMRSYYRLILQLLLFLPVSLSARVITSEVYNGITYTKGYVYDFQVDSIFYTIQDNGVYVSAERYLYASKPLREPNEIVINTSYHGMITIPETVKYNGTVYNVTGIDVAAFKGCSNLDSVFIPNSVLHIGSYAFCSCSNLKKVTLPYSLSVIGESIFRHCSSLESISFPEDLTVIGPCSFMNCEKLKTVYIPNTVKRIYSQAFCGCKGLTVLSIPSSVTEIGMGAFQECINIDSIFWDSDVSPRDVINTCSKTMRYIRLCDRMTTIDNGLFYGCENLTSIIIPEKVKYIDVYAFCGCVNLQKIVIEGSPVIYEFVFMECYSIDSIVLKNHNPPKAGNRYESSYNYWLTTSNPFMKSTYDNAVLSIPDGSFDSYVVSEIWSRFSSLYLVSTGGYESDLEKDTIYYSVQDSGVSVAARVINRDSHKKIIGFDGPLTPRDPITGGQQPRSSKRSISKDAKDDSSFYTPYHGNIVIPESVSVNDTIYTVTGIKYYAFMGSKELETVSIPESVRHLGYGCFAACSGLSSVNLPSCVDKIPDALFYGCSSLGSIEIPFGVYAIGHSAFYGCSGLTEIIIPAGVELIDEYAFAYCAGLKRVVIDGNPVIAETAFIGCGTELEVIRDGVDSVETIDSDPNTDGAVHYSISGIRIFDDTPGLHIIKYRNGTVRKAVVR